MIKWFLVLILALVNVVLATVYFTAPTQSELNSAYSGPPAFEKETLVDVVNSVLRAHRIESYNIRERTIPPGVRSEIRVTVPAGVSITTINFEIHRAARAMGYSISGREDTRTGSVSIHIRDNESIIMTILITRE